MRSLQIPDPENRKKADFLIDPGQGLEAARERVHQIIVALRSGKRSEKSDA